MGKKKGRQPGPQRHAEGQHGEKTFRRFIDQLREGVSARTSGDGATREVEGNHRLHQDRQQHDEAEKNSEKVEAMREVKRGRVDEEVLSKARIPHEGDSQ